MKRTLASALLLALALAWAPAHAQAGDAKMIFWYPGEAGSTEEAQPVIDAFFDYMNRSISPEAISGQYFNTVKGGLDYIARQKPKVGIISWAAWAQNRTKLGGAKVIMATLPLPGGKEMQTYSLVGASKDVEPGSAIYSSEPFDPDFARRHLFPDLPEGVTISQTEGIFLRIKKIAGGEEKGFAILTPTESATLRKLKSEWAKSLKFIWTSKAVPSARVVVFDDGWKAREKFSKTLLTAGDDPGAAEILEELRLKGFSDLK